VGKAFEEFAEQTLFRGARTQVPIENRFVDFIWRGRMIEAKTSRKLDKDELEQLATFAKYAKDKSLDLVYMFLRRPTRGTIDNIQKAGGNVIYVYE
jgi:hypothetical protein